jgi:phosphatidylserine decarboxylase
MIEVVALMVGQIEQRYSEFEYHDPQPVKTGTRLLRGSPKALFRPGSSTVVLLFQSGRVCFADDLLHNQQRKDVRSRYSTAFGRVMVETDVRVRSSLATPGDWRFS